MKTHSSSEVYQTPLTRMLLGDNFHPGGLTLTHQLAIQTLVSHNSKVLDVASGTGTSAIYLAEKFGATVYGIDTGWSGLHRGKSGNDGDVTDKVHFIQGDAAHLPIASDSIDVVFCECAMSTFKLREHVLTEIYRVLKPRGFLAISDVFLNQTLPLELNDELNRWLSISGAYNAFRSAEVVEQNGFYQVRFRDVSSQLLETVHTIESKLAVPGPHLSQMLGDAVKPYRQNWQQVMPSRLAQFIYDGGAGYYTLTARKPG